MSIYGNPAYGDDQRVLTSDSKAPTFLHSWAHVNRPCPCGCRQAFSEARLRQGGARGFGLISSRTGRCRHLHPEEGALLCTVPPSYRFPMPPRSALCLLGQIAAPLQVLWLQAHILAGLQQHFWGWTCIDPKICVKVLQDQLVAHSQHLWMTQRMFQHRSITLQLEDGEQPFEIFIVNPTTVRELALAEKALSGWGHYAVISLHGQRMPAHAFLLPGYTYKVEIRKSAQVLPFPGALDVSGGGINNNSRCLGDKLIWDIMNEMVDSLLDCSEVAPFMLYPFQISHLQRCDPPAAFTQVWQRLHRKSSKDVLTICEIDGHWILLVGTYQQEFGLQWTLYDGLRQSHLLDTASPAVKKLCQLLDLDFLGLAEGLGLQQTHPFTCGTVALLQMASLLGLRLPSQAGILILHLQLLDLQRDGHIFAAGPDDVQKQLALLLSDKGVPLASAPDRAQQVISKLGLKQVTNILQHKHPWADLKACASKPGTMFRLVTQDEQAAYVAMRAQTKHGAQIKNHKHKKAHRSAKIPESMHLDPDQFELDSAHFKDESDRPVGQIAFSDVGADQRGVALCTKAMAQHFLDAPKSISIEALALLLVDTPEQEQIQNANLRPIVIPAKCCGTNEHTLIFGHIQQLGDSAVSRNLAGEESSPDIIDTQVIKFQVFRDQLQADWQDFITAPIRALVQRMEALQLCRGQNCGADCAKFHPGLDEHMDSVIFEIWARSFFNDQGHKTQARDSSLFTVFMRIPEGALDKILTSTPTGVYAEPRGQQPQEPDQMYRVVWLPGTSFTEATHKCRTFSKAICLVRMRQKYGVRVLREDEGAAWAHLRPGIEYVELDIQLIFELFPLPHGTQRQAVCKLLSDWGWAARPLQPGRGSHRHMAWRVGASSQPPHQIMQGFQQDVVITQVKDLKQQTKQPQLIASTRTQKHLRATPSTATSSKTSDPWLDSAFDPWAKAKPSTTSAGDSRPRLDEIKDQLCQDIKSKVSKDIESTAQEVIKAAASSSSQAAQTDEKRLQALEVGMQELKGQNAQMSTWFQQAGERMQANENALGAVQHTLNAHQHEIHTLGTTFQSTMKTIKNDLSTEMTDSFNKQLSRLEALLEKKQRSS